MMQKMNQKKKTERDKDMGGKHETPQSIWVDGERKKRRGGGVVEY